MTCCGLCGATNPGGKWAELKSEAGVVATLCQNCAESLIAIQEADQEGRCQRCRFTEEQVGPLAAVEDPAGLWASSRGFTGLFCQHCLQMIVTLEVAAQKDRTGRFRGLIDAQRETARMFLHHHA